MVAVVGGAGGWGGGGPDRGDVLVWEGVTKDYAEAARWYRLAGEKGISARAVAAIGYVFAGLGVPRDMAESKRWAKLGKRPDKGARRIQIVFAGAVLVAVAFALGLFALQFRTLTGWKFIGVAIFVHVGGAFLVINTLITYGFFIVFPHCSFNFLAPSCTQISDPHTRGFVNSIGSYAMANIIFRFMMIVGLAMDVLAGGMWCIWCGWCCGEGRGRRR